jgi:alpha-beta hydrolase superfamily lysophospholipase
MELRFCMPPASDLLLEEMTLKLDARTQVAVLRHRRQEGSTRPPVLYVHGIQSHPGWFIGSAQALARRGHEVYQVTRRGSGLARRDRGDAASARQLLDDVRQAVDFVAAHSRADRLCLLGVSWGGKLLAAYALGGDPRVLSLTLVAPGLCSKVGLPLGQRLAIGLSWLCCGRRRFDIPLSDPALFTDNPAMRQYLRDDPHRLHQATARFLGASAVLDVRLRRAAPGSITVPTRLILARDDRIIDNAATAALAARLTAGGAKVIELPGCHTLEFEEDAQPFYAALAEAMVM